MTCDAHFRTCPSYSSQKSCVKIWFGLVEPFKSYHVHKHSKKEEEEEKKTLIGEGGGGLHLICNTHFQTRLTYSSQMSCVKIWFGLVEIGGMLIFGGWGEGPISSTDELFQSKVMCENLVWIG